MGKILDNKFAMWTVFGIAITANAVVAVIKFIELFNH